MISEHLLSVYVAARDACGWLTSAELASRAGVAPRTARAHVLTLWEAGILERREVSPGYRYRLTTGSGGRDESFLAKIREALEVV